MLHLLHTHTYQHKIHTYTRIHAMLHVYVRTYTNTRVRAHHLSVCRETNGYPAVRVNFSCNSEPHKATISRPLGSVHTVLWCAATWVQVPTRAAVFEGGRGEETTIAHLYVYTHMHTRTRTRMHARTHARTHAHTHT